MYLAGNDNIFLVEFLLSLKGRTEVVEYIQEYFKKAPKENVANFTKEFMNRKDADREQLRREAMEHGKQKKEKTVSKGATGVDLNSKGPGGPAKTEVQPPNSETGGWEKVGKNKSTKPAKPSKPKGKKSAKGQQVPVELLGFRSNVNFDVLYKGEDER